MSVHVLQLFHALHDGVHSILAYNHTRDVIQMNHHLIVVIDLIVVAVIVMNHQVMHKSTIFLLRINGK